MMMEKNPRRLYFYVAVMLIDVKTKYYNPSTVKITAVSNPVEPLLFE
jgi:hypothetical protein